jgi:phosphoribosylanthranilate isomerase
MALRIKFCGFIRPADAEAAVRAGADALGLNFVPESPRCLSEPAAARAVAEAARETARRIRARVLLAGVFVNPRLSEVLAWAEPLKLDIVQLHGEEPAQLGEQLRRAGYSVWKAWRVGSAEDLRPAAEASWPCDAMLLDARSGRPGGPRGGTGQVFDWTILNGFPRRHTLVLAGGLSAKNVACAVRQVQPDWVDAAGGVESRAGTKDRALMKAFVAAARAADKETRAPAARA